MMNTHCNVIMDLLPLYADDCCSAQSKRMVEEHLKGCPSCRAALKEMRAPSDCVAKEPTKVPAPRAVNERKAAVLQSLAMFLSFIALVAGVSLEAYTPTGAENGKWAVALIVPVTAFLLGQVNWYFVRSFASRKLFAILSAAVTLCIAAGDYVWAYLHYGGFASHSYLWIGIALSAILGAAAGLLSNRFASLLGKE